MEKDDDVSGMKSIYMIIKFIMNNERPDIFKKSNPVKLS
jgi:hypothetical protein